MFKNPLLGKRGCRFGVLSLLFLAGGCGSYQNQSPSITISVRPQKTAIGTGQSTQFSALGDPSGVTWSVAGFTNAGAGTAAPAGTIDASGNYTASSGSQSLVVTVTATSKTDPAESSSATVNVVAPGQVTATNNVEVAQYTISPAASANVSVQFGTDTTYGLTTWTQPAGQRGGAVSLYVAGIESLQQSPAVSQECQFPQERGIRVRKVKVDYGNLRSSKKMYRIVQIRRFLNGDAKLIAKDVSSDQAVRQGRTPAAHLRRSDRFVLG